MSKPNRFEENSTFSVDGEDEELHTYQDALVRKGLEEMQNCHIVSHEEVIKRFKR